jgi:murein DD-endopeptidase MepM/ murein hydrolase activator NlpD
VQNVQRVFIIGMCLLMMCGMIAEQSYSLSDSFEPKFQEVMWTDAEQFAAVTGGLSPQDFIGHSPARWSGNPARELFPDVASAENQPRYVANGSNPHQGVDLTMYEGQLVYAAMDAQVELIARDAKSLRNQMGQVILNLDVDHDGAPDHVYMNYLHVVPDAFLKIGDWVSADTPIATVSAQKPRRYGAHLHFNWSNADNEQSFKTAVFYRHVGAWRFGADLDVLSNEAWRGNVFYVHGAVLNFNNKISPKRRALKRVELFYRKNGGAWNSKPVLMQSVRGSGGLYWSYDFVKLAKKGDRVAFYLNGIRAKDDQFPEPDGRSGKMHAYAWAKWPQDLKHPPRLPGQYAGASIAAYEFEMK